MPDFAELLREIVRMRFPPPGGTATSGPAAHYVDERGAKIYPHVLPEMRVTADAPPGRDYDIGGRTFSSTRSGVRHEGMQILAALVAGRRLARNDTTLAGRTYARNVLGRGTPEPMSRDDFSGVDVTEIADALANARVVRRDSAGINFRDWHREREVGRLVAHSSQQLAKTLGRARATPTPDGGVNISDSYDFNGRESAKGPLPFLYGQNNPQENAEWLGRRALPAGVRGVPVNIRLTAEEVRAADARAQARLNGLDAGFLTMLGAGNANP